MGQRAQLPFDITVSDSTAVNANLTVVRDADVSVLVDIGSALLTFGIQESTPSLANGTKDKII